ncbi:MAG: HAD-IA family hydrolase, partial [Alphaproteobacteria bacterium]|nr:HAD-IA family hydrolase [Alphaproteobacteria bacterium]
DWFDGLVISGLEGVAKPDPGIFQIACARHDITPETAVFIDDRAENVDSARDLGFHGIHFTDAAVMRQEFVELGILS